MIYEMPAYMKPRIKVATWILTMAFSKDLNQELIAELPRVKLTIKDNIEGYMKYQLLTMRKDLRGNPEGYKVFVEPASRIVLPVEEVINEITGGKELGRIRGEFNLLNSSGKKLIEEVYGSLDKDFRRTLNIPTQWLIYIPDKRILTRMCWVLSLSGDIVIRPFGSTNILLEVTNVRFDMINEGHLRQVKQNNLVKDRLNQEWRSLIVSEEMAELATAAEGLTEEAEESKETTPSEVGQVE